MTAITICVLVKGNDHSVSATWLSDDIIADVFTFSSLLCVFLNQFRHLGNREVSRTITFVWYSRWEELAADVEGMCKIQLSYHGTALEEHCSRRRTASVNDAAWKALTDQWADPSAQHEKIPRSDRNGGQSETRSQQPKVEQLEEHLENTWWYRQETVYPRSPYRLSRMVLQPVFHSFISIMYGVAGCIDPALIICHSSLLANPDLV